MSYHIANLRAYKLKDYQKVQSTIFNFLKKSVYMDRKQLIPDFVSLRDELMVILEDKYERRPTLYLDVISWLESKIEGKPVVEIIRLKKVLKRGKSNDDTVFQF